MPVSSVPEASDRVRVGASASAATETSMVPDVVAVSEPSVDVAVTVSWKSSLEFAGGVMTRLSSCSGVSVAVPSVIVTASPSAVSVGALGNARDLDGQGLAVIGDGGGDVQRDAGVLGARGIGQGQGRRVGVRRDGDVDGPRRRRGVRSVRGRGRDRQLEVVARSSPAA
jgi:hypothetical protein